MKTLEEKVKGFVEANTGSGSILRNIDEWDWDLFLKNNILHDCPTGKGKGEVKGTLWQGVVKIVRNANEGEVLTSPNKWIRKCWKYFNEEKEV